MSDESERRLFWKDGECFVGDMNRGEDTVTNLKILRFSDEGDVMAVDASMGIAGSDAVWDLKTMSVAVNKNVCICADEVNKKTPTLIQFPQSKN